MLPARMRLGARWGDVCIINISSRGMMVYAKVPVQPGSYVELRRGEQLVVARVVWRQNNRIGLQSHNRLPVEEIISSDTAAAVAPVVTGKPLLERRKFVRQAEESRFRSRAMEYLAVIAIGTVLAGGLGVYVQQTLARPIHAVKSVLGHR